MLSLQNLLPPGQGVIVKNLCSSNGDEAKPGKFTREASGEDRTKMLILVDKIRTTTVVTELNIMIALLENFTMDAV